MNAVNATRSAAAQDFVIDEYQVDEALAHGADTVLLMVASASNDRPVFPGSVVFEGRHPTMLGKFEPLERCNCQLRIVKELLYQVHGDDSCRTGTHGDKHRRFHMTEPPICSTQASGW